MCVRRGETRQALDDTGRRLDGGFLQVNCGRVMLLWSLRVGILPHLKWISSDLGPAVRYNIGRSAQIKIEGRTAFCGSARGQAGYK